MPFDSNLLIALLGMVLAVGVAALFMGRSKNVVDSDAPPAAVELLLADEQVQLRRYACPDCGQVLRQEVTLRAAKPHTQAADAESGYPPGEVICPACGMRLQIINKSDD